jgi:hypothetical protein
MAEGRPTTPELEPVGARTVLREKTEEQKQAAKDRMAKVRAAKKTTPLEPAPVR